ncbi:excisionase family DNA-binding protein [Deinococcus sp.]|uniref:excisionase family DNA-binding protein n=1 Tax=Deinococcus sp. TaxID=47478 RepID=UPI0025DD18CD|nr:excisionase family DNA-binding protein [Deinococcus sp.]
MTAAFIPDSSDQPQLQAIADELALLPAGGTLYLQLPGHAEPLTLSPVMVRLLRASVKALLEGHAVTLVHTEQELSPVEAAQLLGVSRPFLISHLLDTGKMPHRLVGSHRRLALTDVLAYKADQERRMTIADELSREAQALGLY